MALHHRTAYFIIKVPVVFMLLFLTATLIYLTTIHRATLDTIISLPIIILFLFLWLTLIELKLKRVFVKDDHVVIRDLFFRKRLLEKKGLKLEEVNVWFPIKLNGTNSAYKLIDQSGNEYRFKINTWEFTEGKLRRAIFG